MLGMIAFTKYNSNNFVRIFLYAINKNIFYDIKSYLYKKVKSFSVLLDKTFWYLLCFKFMHVTVVSTKRCITKTVSKYTNAAHERKYWSNVISA